MGKFYRSLVLAWEVVYWLCLNIKDTISASSGMSLFLGGWALWNLNTWIAIPLSPLLPAPKSWLPLGEGMEEAST